MFRQPAIGSNRVLRGGSWNNNPQNCRVVNRNNNSPGKRNNNIGFRLANTGIQSRIDFFTEKPTMTHSVQRIGAHPERFGVEYFFTAPAW